jgi:hypothetical protein
MDARSETEHQRARAVEQQIVSLLEHARGLIIEQFVPLVAALERAEQLVGEAHTRARQFNFEVGQTLVFSEDFELTIGPVKGRWWQTVLTPSVVRVSGQTAPQPGIRIQLAPDVQMGSYPRRCTVAVPCSQAERLIADHRGARV